MEDLSKNGISAKYLDTLETSDDLNEKISKLTEKEICFEEIKKILGE